MRLIIPLILILFVPQVRAENSDLVAIRSTMDGLTAAFAKGDLKAIASFHHPKVEKALSFSKRLVGRDAVMADLRGTLGAYTLIFTEHVVESLEVYSDTCIEMTRFQIRGEPKGRAQPFVVRGRAMVVYVRYSESPTGWASIREVVQPYSE